MSTEPDGAEEAMSAPGVSDELLVSRTVHELSSPLTVIGGFSETLLRHHTEMSHAQRERYLSAIQRHTERLTRVVADLGHLQRVRSGRTPVRATAVPVVDAVRDALQICASVLGRPALGDLHDLSAVLELDLTIAEEAIAHVDETHFVRMLVNLLDNSFKYGDAPRRLTVTNTRTQVIAWVADHGEGIPLELRERIFEPYERGDSQRLAGITGSGLGLSIVAELAALNGGTARLVETTRGTCFELIVPAGRNEHALVESSA